MSSNDDLPPRDRWARLRFAIIGPLLAAPPADGELQVALRDLAAKRWRHPLLCVVLAGDARLLDKLRREELIPPGSRIRTRLATEIATREEPLACLDVSAPSSPAYRYKD